MLSILPSQRGNSELCRDAVACDGPPFLRRRRRLRRRSPPPSPSPPPPPSSCPPLLTAPLARGVCSPPLCPTGAHPSMHTGDASAMHRIPRTPEGTPGSRFRRRLVFETPPSAKPVNAESTLAISRFSRQQKRQVDEHRRCRLANFYSTLSSVFAIHI